MSRRRVVVTGLGIVSPVGIAVAEAWDNVLAGKSGITRITRFDPSRLTSQIAGEVKGFDVSQYLSPKEARRMDTFIHYGMAAGFQAWRDAGVTLTPESAERAGVNFGSGIGGLPMIEATHDELPFTTAVLVESWADPGEEGVLRIGAAILVERDSHKGILVGKRGETIKKIGTAARLDLEDYLERRIFLDLRVRLEPDWRENPRLLAELDRHLLAPLDGDGATVADAEGDLPED